MVYAKEPSALPILAHVELVRCPVCRHIAKQAFREAKRLRALDPPTHSIHASALHFSEESLFNHVEAMCTDTAAGAWIRTLDIVLRNGEEPVVDRVALVDQKQKGHCRRECATIQRACTDLLDAHDDLLVALLYDAKATRASVTQGLCHKGSRQCASDTLDALRHANPPKDRKQAQRHKRRGGNVVVGSEAFVPETESLRRVTEQEARAATGYVAWMQKGLRRVREAGQTVLDALWRVLGEDEPTRDL